MFAKRIILVGLLALAQLLLFSWLDAGTNSLLFCANLFFIYCGLLYAKRLKNFRWSIYLAGYFALFFTLIALSQRPLIFILVLFLYASLFHLPRILGYLFIFIFCIIIFTAYWISGLIVFSLFYFIILEFIRKRGNVFITFMFGMGFLLLALILLPLLNLLFQSSLQTLASTLNQDIRNALAVSFGTAFISTLIIFLFGVPLGFFMARIDFKFKPLVDALIDLPILVPQTAAGIALLVFLGPKTPLGNFFNRVFGINFAGSYLGIIVCQIFVSMPFLVRSAISAFESVNPKFENVSRTLGTDPRQTFFKVSLPLALPGIFNGCILSFCRALSESGSLMIVAYRPSTIPIYVYDVFVQYGTKESVPITIMFLIICLWSFVVLKWIYETRRKSILRI
ncbi:MAG: ABC transporter permease [Candidatus Omnitrophota bacterium]